MKSVVILFSFICVSSIYADDQLKCEVLKKVLEQAQINFEKAEFAVTAADQICPGERHPKICYLELRRDYQDAYQALTQAVSNYQAAKCPN